MEKDEEIRWEFIIISSILPAAAQPDGRMRGVCVLNSR